MSDSTEWLTIEPLSRDAFAPFGQAIVIEGHTQSHAINGATAMRHHALAQVVVDAPVGQPVISLVRARPRTFPFRLQLLERHPLGSQAFVALGEAAFLVVVAPSVNAGAGNARPALHGLRCFYVPPGCGVNYAAGVWHHPLIAVGAAATSTAFLVVDRAENPGTAWASKADRNLEEFSLGETGPWLAWPGSCVASDATQPA